MASIQARAGLAADLPAPVVDVNRFGASPFLIVGDHAGNAIPDALGTLGLDEAERSRHIAWDIGTQALGQALAARLDARFLAQRYSRLVIDCNRDPHAADAAPAISDGTVVPGNAGLPAAARGERIAAIHAPYQAAIAAAIGERRETVLVSLHSFTPQLRGGGHRPWQVGVLHAGHADGFALALLAALAAEPELTVGDNEPYRMDATDHTVPRHAFAAGLPYAEIEVRQDLIADETGVARWTDLLVRALTASQPRGS